MKLVNYKTFIQNLPVRQQCFTTQRDLGNWKTAEAEFDWFKIFNDKHFGGRPSLTLSRKDIFETKGDLREMIFKTIYWGYPAGMRGKNFINLCESIVRIEDSFGEISNSQNLNSSEFKALVKNLKEIKGIGISTYSKLLYFMGIRYNDFPCMILDRRLIKVFNRSSFLDYESIKQISYNTATKKYLDYLELTSNLALSLDTKEENIEQFLFIFGDNLKCDEAVQQEFQLSNLTIDNQVSNVEESEYPELEPHRLYYPLQEHIRKLKHMDQFEIEITFIEQTLLIVLNNTCFNAPAAFWGNGGWETNVQKRAWLSQGFEVFSRHGINFENREGTVGFRKLTGDY